MFRVNGKPAIGLAIAMRDGGDILALGRNRATDHGRDHGRPAGRHRASWSPTSRPSSHAIGEFMKALWEAIAIVLAVSFISLGLRAGAVVALSIPLTLAIVFPVMEFVEHRSAAHFARRPDHRAGLLVDDAMITVEAMTTRLAQGDAKEQAATFAYKSLAFPMLTGTLVTVAGFVPIGFARSAAGEYTFSIFAVVTIALIASWFVAVLFVPLLGVALLKPPEHGATSRTRPGRCASSAVFSPPMRARWITILMTLALFVVSLLALPFVPRQFFPASDRPELLVDLRLPQNASIYASRDLAAGSMRSSEERSRCRALEHLCRTRRDPVLPAAQRPAPQRFLRQAVIVAKDSPPASGCARSSSTCCETISRAR